MINFRGLAKRLDDIDLPRVARLIGCGEDEVHALLDVEAGGRGFDKLGRPKMLYEPHIFYRLLSGEKREQAVAEGLAYPHWRPGTYPSDSYPRLIAAMRIDETAALKAASWGLGQILGENHRAAGYQTVQAMVADFTQDEDKHLEAMVRFIKAKGLDDDLRNHQWDTFARGYNGALYAAHGYHLKLRAAFERWQQIKDTPIPPDVEPLPNVPAPKPKPRPSVGRAATGAGVGAVVAGGGGVIANEANKKGASTAQIATVVCITLAFAAVVAFLIMRWRKS